MTASYQSHVGASGAGAFNALLFTWRGSLYKLVYKELILFLLGFGLLSAVYRLALNETQKEVFEEIVHYFDDYLNMIPLSFILGFYVTTIATRWWNQFMALPWPDRLLLCVTLYFPGEDEESRAIRWNLLRYMTLMLILVLQTISESVRNKYPELEDIVRAGFLTKDELELYKSIKTDVNIYWVPGTWFVHLLRQCGLQGRIDSEGVKLVMEEFLEFRARCSVLWNYNWVSIPLVYTQVVTMATYSFFFACLFGRQSVKKASGPEELPVDIYFPFWTVLQFLFYMGLLKVAEQMINPYGEDDEDFELNYLIERHMKVIRLAAEVLADMNPPLQRVSQFHNNNNSTENRLNGNRLLPRPLVRSMSTLQSPVARDNGALDTVSLAVEKVKIDRVFSADATLNRLIDRIIANAEAKISTTSNQNNNKFHGLSVRNLSHAAE